MDYLLGALAGAVSGLAAAFFAQGGFADWKLFVRLSRMKGRWHRRRWLLAGVGGAMGLYLVWVCGGLSRSTVGLLLLSGLLLAASVTDLRRRQIHMDCVLCYSGLFLVYHLTAFSLAAMLSALIGALVGTAALGLPRLLRPQSVGGGDVLLLAACGFISGFPGLLYLLFRGMLAMAVFGVIQLIRKKVQVKSSLPLAPFLLFGALI